jgi:hypothetical protein
MLRVFLGLLICVICSTTSAQPRVSDLQSELAAGRVKLLSIAGTGGSSGTVVTARLLNVTASEIRLETYLSRPVLFSNSGSSQDMIAGQVYLDGGKYLSDGRRSFIVLPPKVSSKVVFVAYCIDFEKDNPTDADTFSIGIPPPQLAAVLDSARAHLRANPNANIVVATQAAIWLKQGVSLNEIRKKFGVSADEAQLAQQLTR